MSDYPKHHHPLFFLADALEAEGATVANPGKREDGLWGMTVNGTPVVYLMDVRWPHERAKVDMSRLQGAVVCAAQKRDADELGCYWLPLAVTPGYGPPARPVEKIVDVGFVGYIRDHIRVQVFADLAPHFSVSVAQGAFGDAAVNTYHQARVGLNVPTQYGDPLCYDVNMRVFEIAATGTPLVTNYLPELEDLEIPCVTYASLDDIRPAIEMALDTTSHDAREVAEFMQANHTYKQRAMELLEWL